MDRVKKLIDDDEGTSGNERGITLIPCQNLRGKDLRGMMSPFSILLFIRKYNYNS